MLRHLMTSWHLNIWKFKIWLYQGQKELSKWNRNYFFLFHRCTVLYIQKNSQNAAGTTFKPESINFWYSSNFLTWQNNVLFIRLSLYWIGYMCQFSSPKRRWFSQSKGECTHPTHPHPLPFPSLFEAQYHSNFPSQFKVIN